MKTIYAMCDVVALPTHREGLPYVPLEAAAMAVPVVATNIPGCRDAVVDGITGTLVGVDDVEALASALKKYANNPTLRNAHGAAGRARILREFERDDCARRLIDRYREFEAMLNPSAV